MNIIDFEGVREQKECTERANHLRELIRNADLSWMDEPRDLLNPPEPTQEEKVAARKRYAEELKEYRLERQEFDFAQARYEQGIDKESPLFPPLPPFPPSELIPSSAHNDDDSETLSQEIDAWWEEINPLIEE